MLWLSTVITGPPTNLAAMNIAAIRAAVQGGAQLLTPPIAWSSLWLTLPLCLLTWDFATWFAGRTIGLKTLRPPGISVQFGAEPRRDAQGMLDGWPEMLRPQPPPTR